MPPKKTNRWSSNNQGAKEIEEGGKLRSKKDIGKREISEETSLKGILDKYHAEDTSEKERESTEKRPRKSISTEFFEKCRKANESEIEDEIQKECMACLEDDFQQGKYILDCLHVFCNSCFVYWSKISQICPFCLEQSLEVLMVLGGEKRIKKVEPKYKPLKCQTCKGVDHEEQMYFCDGCEEKCVHIYCEESLTDFPERNARWFCEDCKRLKFEEKKRRKKGKARQKRPVIRSSFLEDEYHDDLANFSASTSFTFTPRNEARQQQSRSRKERKPRGK